MSLMICWTGTAWEFPRRELMGCCPRTQKIVPPGIRKIHTRYPCRIYGHTLFLLFFLASFVFFFVF